MILKTLVSGRDIAGFARKKIIHPYSGASPDSIEYARDVNIPAFDDVKNIRAFRVLLARAAEAVSLYFKKNKNKILKIASDETGSPVSYHKEDLEASREFLKKIYTLEKLFPKKYLFEPKGNVLLILSANEPIIMATILTFSSLFMGNTVYVKPSSKTPSFSYFLIRELLKIPALKNRIHYLLTDAGETERLIKARAFDFVLSFGSRTTSKKLSIACADSEVEFLQESEGNDWAYVDKDCVSLQNTSKILVNSFLRHNGQMCNSVRGVLVHSSLYDAFVHQLKSDLSSVCVGSPESPKTQIGALIAGTAARARTLVEEVLMGAEEVWSFSAKDNVITPTLVLNPDSASLLLSESIFAPVLWVRKVRSHSEAISFYKEKNMHGLGFSVFSKNKKIVDEFINRIKVGRISINKQPLHISVFDPLGGVKLSGDGGPSHWIEKVSNRKYISK